MAIFQHAGKRFLTGKMKLEIKTTKRKRKWLKTVIKLIAVNVFLIFFVILGFEIYLRRVVTRIVE